MVGLLLRRRWKLRSRWRETRNWRRASGFRKIKIWAAFGRPFSLQALSRRRLPGAFAGLRSSLRSSRIPALALPARLPTNCPAASLRSSFGQFAGKANASVGKNVLVGARFDFPDLIWCVLGFGRQLRSFFLFVRTPVRHPASGDQNPCPKHGAPDFVSITGH